MKSQFRFFYGLAIGIMATLACYFVVFQLCLGVPTEGSRWAFEINSKKLALASAKQPPRLLLIGGSGTLFGISAQEIQRQTHWPTINLGSHAGLGTKYILRLAEQAAKPGDTILLTLEYELYTCGNIDPSWASKIAIDFIMSRDLDFYRQLTFKEKAYLFLMAPTPQLAQALMFRFFPPKPNRLSTYDVSNIDEWGDQGHHDASERPVPISTVTRMKATLAKGISPDENGFAVVATFCHWAQANHIRVLATFPNLCDLPDYHTEQARESAERITRFFEKLHVPVVGTYSDGLLPVSDFFDTDYHLTSEAALGRSQRLAKQLEPFLKAPTPLVTAGGK